MKDFLKKISSSGNVAVYEIEPRSKIKRFVITSSATRRILNAPEIHGFEYIYFLRKGIESFFKSSYGKKHFGGMDDSGITVLHFLRGGLNFGFVELLYKCFGFKKVNSSFMTSQRFQKGKRWMIKQDQYRKFALEGVNTIIAGDVIATGTTLKNGFDCLLKLAGSSLENFIFFTIGTPYTEKIIERYFDIFKKRNAKFQASIFYIEGRFSLVESKDEYPLCIPGTDLVKKNALLTPEFELSQTVSSVLERCEIYDVGARAFDWRGHFRDLIEYWEGLASREWTVLDVYNMRWPFPYNDYNSFRNIKRELWPGIREAFLKKLYERELKRIKYAITLDSWEFLSEHLKFLKNIYAGGKITKRAKEAGCLIMKK